MRGCLIRLAVIGSLACAGLTFLTSGPAKADTGCQVTDPQTGVCVIWVHGPGKPSRPGQGGPKNSGPGQPCYWDPAKQGLTRPPAGPVPCTSEYGYWSNSYNCYIALADPQPPAGDPSWQGHHPGDGAVYQCYQPQTDILIFIWSQDPPPRSGGGPSPREVAQLAIDRMRLRAINIGIAPKPGQESVGLVGMPVWMWVKNPNGHTFGPEQASATAGGVTVTAWAQVAQITWDMGDGTNVVCRTAGTPYDASYGNKTSPDCGHVYDVSSANRPNAKFTVTATSQWVITWRGGGQSGTIQMNDLTNSVEVTIGEAQVLVK